MLLYISLGSGYIAFLIVLRLLWVEQRRVRHLEQRMETHQRFIVRIMAVVGAMQRPPPRKVWPADADQPASAVSNIRSINR